MGGVVRAIKKIVKKVVKAVVNVFSGFMGAFGMSMDTPEMGGGAGYEAVAQGITVNKQSNVAGIPVVYGKRKVGGTRVFVTTSGTDQKYLYVCLAVAEGEINGFTQIYINDEPQDITSFPLATNVDVPTSSKFNVNGTSRARFQFFTGTEDQSASSLLKEQSDWTDNHRLRGVAYVACRFEWVKPEHNKDTGEQTLFNPWQGIPTIQVDIEGKKVLTNYPNTGSGASLANAKDTSNDTSSYNSDFNSGFSYSTNPADCLMDYLRNPRYGKGLNDNRIDFKAFQVARAVCNLSKNFGTFTGNFLECNTHLDVSQTMFGNTKKLLQTCRGFLPYTNGKYQLKIEAGETTPENLLVIDDSKIIGPINIASEEKNNKYNSAHITFSNEQKNYEPDTAIYVANGTNGTQDHLGTDGEALVLTMSSPGITNRERALTYAEYMVERSRKQLQVSLRATSEAQQLVAGDLVSVVHRYEHTDNATGTAKHDFLFNSVSNSEATTYTDPKKIFRVTGTKLNYDGTVDLVLIEHQNNIYDVRIQSEDRDLSIYQKYRGGGGKPIKRILPIKILPILRPIVPPAVTTQAFKLDRFVYHNPTTNAKTAGIKVAIDTANHTTNTFTVKMIYRLHIGSQHEDFETPYTDARANFYTSFQGKAIPFNTTVNVSAYEVQANGNRQLIASGRSNSGSFASYMNITTSQDPASVSGGGI